MNTRDTSIKSFEFGWELMISLIKPPMSNRITIGGLSSNLEESIWVCLDQGRDVDPQPPNDGKTTSMSGMPERKSRPMLHKSD